MTPRKATKGSGSAEVDPEIRRLFLTSGYKDTPTPVLPASKVQRNVKKLKRLNQKTVKEKRIRVRIKNQLCHLCNHKTDSASKLETHIKAKHYGIHDFKCPLCDQTASTQSNIDKHVKAKHYGIHDFKCPHCDHAASTQWNIDRHVNASHYGIKDFQCPHCDHAAYTKAELDRHVNGFHYGIKDFQCHLCDQTASTQSNIDQHVKAKHYGIKDFQCHLCDQTASTQSNIDRHVNASHYGIKDFECPLCDHAASTKQNLDHHVNASHYGIKDFQCPHCDHAASTKQNLDLHVNGFHYGIKDFQCPHCEHNVSTKQNLDLHVGAIHEMTPVNCFLCEHIAPNDNQLLVHISKIHFHQGSRQCPLCDYFDVYGSNLKPHLEAVHDDYSMSLPGAKSNYGADLVEQPAQVAPHQPRVILGFADKVMKNCSPFLVNLRREKGKLQNQKTLDRHDSIPYTASEIRENQSSWWSYELEIRKKSNEMVETTGNGSHTYIMLDSGKVTSLYYSLEDEAAAFQTYKASVITAGAGKGQATNLLLHALQEYGLVVRNPNMLPLTETSAAILDCWSSGFPVVILELFPDSNWTEAVARESCLLAALGIPDRVKKVIETNRDLTASWTDQKKIQCGCLLFFHGFLQFVQFLKPVGFRVTDLNLEPHLLAEAEHLIEHYKRTKTAASQREEPFLVLPAAVGRDAFPEGLPLKLQEMVRADDNQRGRQGSRSDYNSDNDFKDDDIYQPSTTKKGAKGKALALIDGLARVERPRSSRTGKRQYAALASTEETNGPNHSPKLARLSNRDSDEGRIITKLKRVGDCCSVFPEN